MQIVLENFDKNMQVVTKNFEENTSGVITEVLNNEPAVKPEITVFTTEILIFYFILSVNFQLAPTSLWCNEKKQKDVIQSKSRPINSHFSFIHFVTKIQWTAKTNFSWSDVQD